MYYFCVNNNYHLHFDRRIIHDLIGDKILIQVPYSLNLNDTDGYSNVVRLDFNRSISLKRLLLNFQQIRHIVKAISSQFTISSQDALFIHTDINIINAVVIELFAKYHAKIFLLEDGTATMCDFNRVPNNLGLVERLRTYLIKYVCGLKNTYVVDFGDDKHLRVKDALFNKIVVSWGNKTLRNIPVLNIGMGIISHQAANSGAIFFNQPMYLFFCTEDEYLHFISQILSLHTRFTVFYFKFHPQDTDSMKSSIRLLIETRFSFVKIIEDEEPAELIVVKYPIKYSISYTSTCTLNHIVQGIIPIFLVEIFNQFKPSNSHESFKKFLCQIGCEYPTNLNQIDEVYNPISNLIICNDGYDINEILNDNDGMKNL